MATLVIEQPNYLPWTGYFDLMDQSDLWVWLDDVQYTRRDWRSRNKVAGAGGAPRWLTVPVRSRGRREQRLCDAEIDHEQDWVRKHLETLQHCYRKAPHFEPVQALLTRHLEARPALLCGLTIPLCEDLAALLGIETRFWRSSQLEVGGSKQDRLLEIHAAVGGEVYLSGPRAADYIQPAGFAAAGVELRYIEYRYGPYPRGGQGFVPGLSIVDALCWLGPEATRAHWRAVAGSRPAE